MSTKDTAPRVACPSCGAHYIHGRGGQCPLHRAAPDLLAALKEIVAARDIYHGGDLKRAIDAARPAIAKAEEES